MRILSYLLPIWFVKVTSRFTVLSSINGIYLLVYRSFGYAAEHKVYISKILIIFRLYNISVNKKKKMYIYIYYNCRTATTLILCNVCDAL